MKKILKIEVVVDDESNDMKTAVLKDGFAGVSGDLEIIGILDELKRRFYPNLKAERRFKN
jgi:hypothetical protein